MYKFAYFIISILAISCFDSNESFSHTLLLYDKNNDTLGIVSCSLPSDFDTTYRWINNLGCCDCCGSIANRCHSKVFDVVMETGNFPTFIIDTGFYFTISHLLSLKCDTQNPFLYSDLKTQAELRKRNIEGFVSSLRIKSSEIADELIIDTSRTINNITYDIYYYTDYNSTEVLENDSLRFDKSYFNVVTASTHYHNRFIHFEFWNNVDQKDDFYNLAFEIIQSIKIEDY